jgi:hypothetical protein
MLTEFILGAVQVVVQNFRTAITLNLVLTPPADAVFMAVFGIRNHGAITPERINAPMKNGIAR